jgi:hypothetical protein
VLGVLATPTATLAARAAAPSPDRAIVITRASAHLAPFAGSESAFDAPEGEAVEITQQRGEFVFVRDGDRSGWIPRATVERVVVERATSAT